MNDHKQRPKVSIGVIVVKDGKVLLGKRKSAHGDGTWQFPGGHLEWNESWEDCARRESLEEAGIQIDNPCFVGVTNDLFTEQDKHYITLFILCEYVSGDVRVCEPEKCERWEWFTWDKMPRPLFLPIENLIKQGYGKTYPRPRGANH